MSIRRALITIVLGTSVFGHSFIASSQTSSAAPSSNDPAVYAYTTLVDSKKLDVPVDREFVVAALDRLVSAAEALALTEAASNENIWSTAHQLRREIRHLGPKSSNTPSEIEERWDVFLAIAHLVTDVSRERGSRGAPKWLTDSLLRAADGLDYDYPLRWQPSNITTYLDLASRALKQMMSSVR